MFTPQALHIGSLIIPWLLVAGLVAILAGTAIASRFRTRFHIALPEWNKLKDSIWSGLLVGMMFARLGFVLANASLYFSHPLDILKIQDKGFNLLIGGLAALIWLIWRNRQLPRKFLAICLGSMLAIFLTGALLVQQVQHQYQQFPALTLTGLNQKSYALEQFSGQHTVINLWASWCPPCRREMPILQQAEQQHPDIRFVFINQGEDAATVQEYLARQHLNFSHVLLDPYGETAQATGMYGLPSTLFFNSKGELVETHLGEISQAVLQHKLQQLTASEE